MATIPQKKLLYQGTSNIMDFHVQFKVPVKEFRKPSMYFSKTTSVCIIKISV